MDLNTPVTPMPEDPPLRVPPLLSQSRSRPRGDATGGVIPYLNPLALGAYYLGVFSVIPGTGFFCAVGAVPLGIGGLRERRHRPEVRGTVHAWIGIVLGSLSFAAHVLVAALMVTIIVGAIRQTERANERLREQERMIGTGAYQAQVQRVAAERAKTEVNLLYLRGFAQAYFQEHPTARKVTDRELKSWLPSDARLQSIAGKDYDDLVIRRGAQTLSVRLPDGVIVSIDAR